MKRQAINPPSLHKPYRPTYSNIVVVEEAKKLVFVSGQVSLDEHGNTVGKGDMLAQTRQVLENLKGMLNSVGASLEDIIKLTIYMTDLSRYEEVTKIRLEYFKKDPPSATLVKVAGLVHPDWMIEIEAVAALS